MTTPLNPNPRFYKIMLGKGSSHLPDALTNGYVGVGWFADTSLVDKTTNNYSTLREFNNRWRPVYLSQHPDKSKVTAGLACGCTYTVCFDMSKGDFVLSPKGDGTYLVGIVSGEYEFVPNTELPHRRKVDWSNKLISKEDISQQLKNSMGSIGTVINISGYAEEIQSLLGDLKIIEKPTIVSTNPDVENASVFALEEHLEDFLIKNWSNTELGKTFDIYEDEENTGRQFPTDTGPLDILAISKDKNELLVIELKKGRATDVVLGQIQRYMGYVLDELADPNQKVSGLIIGFDEDQKLKRALRVAQNVEYYRYEVNFKLKKGFAED
jgi:restriction system protein